MADTDIEFYRGDTVTWTCTFLQNGVAFNITGAYLWFTAKTNKEDLDADAIILKRIGPITPTGVGNNITTFTLNPGDASPTNTAVAVGSYFYDFQLVIGTTVTTLGVGKLKVLQDETITTSTV